MTEPDDIALLKQYTVENSEAAFAALVGRRVNLVYSTALRSAGDAHAAGEITQAVFIILARKAKNLSSRTILTGWLHQTTRLTAANYLRTEIRRRNREQEAFMQSTFNQPEAEAWTQIAPLLDDAISKLGEKERNAILLRYFENKSACEMAGALRIDPATAQKRVTRAVEKLRAFFAKRGVTLTAAAIASAVSANSIQAAPAGLAKTITAVAIAKGAAASASTLIFVKGALKIMAWTKMKTTIVVGTAVLLASTTSIVAIKAIQNHRPPQKLEERTFRVDPNQPVLKSITNYFAAKGMDFRPPKSIVFNDQLGLLFVRATSSDMNAVETIISQLSKVPPQVHIKAYFIKVPESDVESILKTGKAVGNADKNIVEVLTANQLTQSQRELKMLGGAETLSEPEVTTTSGRQTRIMAGNSSVDLIPTVLVDNCTVIIKAIVSAPETLTAQAEIWDRQTLLLGSQNSDGNNRLLVFITTTLVDPAGNPIHTDKDLPFAQNAIPQQE